MISHKSMLCALAISVLLTSCQIYRSEFDCPPGIGVPCTSVSDIEGMIVETEEGSDVFTGGEGSPRELWQERVMCRRCCSRRVWIQESQTSSENIVEGHYVYFSDDLEGI